MNFTKIQTLARLGQKKLKDLGFDAEFANIKIEAYLFDDAEFNGMPLAVYRGLNIENGKITQEGKWGILHTRTGGSVVRPKLNSRAEAIEALHYNKEKVLAVIKDPTKLIRNLSKFHSAIIVEVDK